MTNVELDNISRFWASLKSNRNRMHLSTMNRKNQVFLFLGLALIAISTCLPIGLTAVSVGVKKGDWVEYNASIQGTADEAHNVVWARMEVTDVQNAAVVVKIIWRSSSGEEESSTATLNLEKGKLGDQFIIPANLNVGDTFLDQYAGNVTISGNEKRVVAGAERTLLYFTSDERSTYWDKATGILIEGRYSSGFTMTTTLDKTNIWQPDNTIYVLSAIALLLLGVALVVFAIRRRKKTDSTR